MAKTPARKTTPKKAVSKTKKVASISIENVISQALDNLISIDAAPQLQSEIKWCLGSYQYDKNPKGLYETGAKALMVLTIAKTENTKLVPAKLIADLNKALKQS